MVTQPTSLSFAGAIAHDAEGITVDKVPAAHIASVVGTPVYAYAQSEMLAALAHLRAAFGTLPVEVLYALKANSNQAVIKLFANADTGADVVSAGEIQRALAAGIDPARIAFPGVGKTAAEMDYALSVGIGQFNVESESELDLLASRAAVGGATAKVALRVNPDVDAGTHEKITTGRKHNKFGVPFTEIPALYQRAATAAGIEPIGLHMHIGSQLTDITAYRAAFTRLAALVGDLRAAGHTVSHLDIGGGMGIRYQDEQRFDAAAYAALVQEIIAPLGCHIAIEPGRYLVGEAGVLLTRVLHVKRVPGRRFIIVDAAMNDLIRPTLYEAYHPVWLASPTARPADPTPADVVGPICETGDILARVRALPAVEAGDLLAIGATGAYGAVMASAYNSRALVPEVLAHAGVFSVVRPRVEVSEIIQQDQLPDWLS